MGSYYTPPPGSGGGGSPAAPDTSIQFNNSGSFGGTDQLTWDGVTAHVGDLESTLPAAIQKWYGDVNLEVVQSTEHDGNTALSIASASESNGAFALGVVLSPQFAGFPHVGVEVDGNMDFPGSSLVCFSNGVNVADGVHVSEFKALDLSQCFTGAGSTLDHNIVISIGDVVDGATSNIAIVTGLGDVLFGDTVTFRTPAAGLKFTAGANGRTGTGTLVGGTVDIANTSVTANSLILVTNMGGGVLANLGSLFIASQTAGVGFTVQSSNALDTSSFKYLIVEAA